MKYTILLVFLPMQVLYLHERIRTEQQYTLTYIDKNNRNSITSFYQRHYSRGGKVPSDKKRMISFSGKGIDSLKGISQFSETPFINLNYNPIRNIDEIKHLKNLKKLWLSHTDIKSVSSLKNLEKLEELSINSTFVREIASLSANIRLLHIDNDIEDLDIFLQKRSDCRVFKTGDPESSDPAAKCKVFLDNDYIKSGKGCPKNTKAGVKKTDKTSS